MIVVYVQVEIQDIPQIVTKIAQENVLEKQLLMNVEFVVETIPVALTAMVHQTEMHF